MPGGSLGQRRRRQFALLVGCGALVLGVVTVLSHDVPLVIAGVVILVGAALTVVTAAVGLAQSDKPLR
ncbi:hypothetical protein [Curtobacterium sp. ISL-83]|uniref:hypothetical protein n=1 Tax=Curtobacterium sp. ISL-83 TaxID=2819145 RepID=UPI001BE55152|nr:hypothetical protein [Curtobacterium sp. ISL-83]MBT2503728.1 hypothetical protein [Curtobacterium sp. ISL-83]